MAKTSNHKSESDKAQKEAKSKTKAFSKTWLAFLKNAGTGQILDLQAVLK